MLRKNPSIYEKILLKEISIIEKKITDLMSEKHALQRQLQKAYQENVDLNDVHRKNSINRVMVEMSVIQILKESTKPLHTKTLFNMIKNMNYSLNPNTFRIYLHRMKNKSMICNANKNGIWRLNDLNK